MLKTKWETNQINWLKKEPDKYIDCEVVARYGGKPVKARVKKTTKGDGKVTLEQKIRAVTPGQSAVFYNDDEVLGGGIIK